MYAVRSQLSVNIIYIILNYMVYRGDGSNPYSGFMNKLPTPEKPLIVCLPTPLDKLLPLVHPVSWICMRDIGYMLKVLNYILHNNVFISALKGKLSSFHLERIQLYNVRYE